MRIDLAMKTLIQIADAKADELEARAGKADGEEVKSLKVEAKQAHAASKPLRTLPWACRYLRLMEDSVRATGRSPQSASFLVWVLSSPSETERAPNCISRGVYAAVGG